MGRALQEHRLCTISPGWLQYRRRHSREDEFVDHAANVVTWQMIVSVQIVSGSC
jgi:hypothetical protein